MSGPGTNTGHGHVWARPDGYKARCGGAALCRECARDAVEFKLVPRSLHDEMARQFTDQGKLIEAGFVGFIAASFPQGCPDFQREDLRMAFFGGAQHLMGSIFGFLEEGEEPTDADMRRMNNIQAELEEFIADFAKRRIPVKGGLQ